VVKLHPTARYACKESRELVADTPNASLYQQSTVKTLSAKRLKNGPLATFLTFLLETSLKPQIKIDEKLPMPFLENVQINSFVF